MSKNPRRTNGARRSALRKRVASWGLPCALCGKPIDYSLTTYVDPRDGKVKRHPMSYELDEIVPVSRGGSPYDIDNVQPTHRICNQRRGNKPMGTARSQPKAKHDNPLPKSRNWLAWDHSKDGLPNSGEW